MKKLTFKILFLLGAFLFLGGGQAWADRWQVHGTLWTSSDNSNDWGSREMARTADNEWVYSGSLNSNSHFGIRNMNDKNDNQDEWYSFGEGNSTVDVGVQKTLVKNGWQDLWWNNSGDYTIKFNTQTHAITIYTGLSDSPLYILSTDYTNKQWNLSEKGNKLISRKTYDGDYTGTLIVNQNSANIVFSTKYANSATGWDEIAKTRWVPISQSDDTHAYKVGQTYKGDIVQATTGSWVLPKGTYNFTVNLKNKTFEITPTKLDYTVWWVGIGGDFTNHVYDTYQAQPNSEGIATISNVPLGTNPFQIKVYNSTADAFYNKASSTIIPGNWVSLSYVNNSTCTVSGVSANEKYDIEYNVVTDQIRIVPKDLTGTSSIYLVGRGNGLSYSLPGKKIDCNADGDYVFTVRGMLQFQISTSNSSDWDNEGFNANKITPTGGAKFDDNVLNGQTLNSAKGNNVENIILPWKGEYTITVAKDFSKISAKTKTPKPQYWSIYGEMSNGELADYRMMQDEENNDIWRVAIPVNGKGKFNLRKVSGSVNKSYSDYYASSSTTFTTSKTSAQLGIANIETFSQYELPKDGIYEFTWNTHTNKLTIRELNTLYIYGHIKKGSWEPGNYAELKKGEDGKYTAKSINFAGQWNYKDVWMDGNRVLSENSDVCYFAVYPMLITLSGFDDAGSDIWKYGTKESENNIDEDEKTKKNKNLDLLQTNLTAQAIFQKEAEKNNFALKGDFGRYDVEFDPATGELTLTSTGEGVNEGTFTWYFGDSDNDNNANATELDVKGQYNDMPYYTHSIKASDTHKNVVQVGYDQSPKHPAARQAKYEIYYSQNSGIKTSAKRMEAPNGFTVVQDSEITYDKNNDGSITDKDGNVVDGNNVGKVTIIGSDNYKDNHLIQLNQAGRYYIVASLENSESYRGVDESISPAAIVVTLAQESVILNINGSTSEYEDQDEEYKISKPFDTKGEIVMAGLFSFRTSDNTVKHLAYNTDFSVTIEPVDADKWVNVNDFGDNDTDAYWKALNVFNTSETKKEEAGLYQQWFRLQQIGDTKVDGFYKGWDENSHYTVSGVGDAYDLNLKPNCSGIYEMTITPIGTTYSFDERTVRIEVYPNLVGTFGNEPGFNIDGYKSGDYSDATPSINLPQSSFDWYEQIGSIDKVTSYIPGTYFADVFIETTEDKGNIDGPAEPDGMRIKRKSDETEGTAPATAYNYFTGVDLSALSKANQNSSHPISVYVEKNGASHTYNFLVVKSDNGVEAPTGVEVIGAEDGEAVYFNLQGVKVQNPEHGIYVKVVNGKATKVIL